MKSASELKEKILQKLKYTLRNKSPNAHVSMNEVSSDIDYYSDCGKHEGLVEGVKLGVEACIEELSKSEGFKTFWVHNKDHRNGTCSVFLTTEINGQKVNENALRVIDMNALASANAKIMQLEEEKAELEQALKEAREVIEFYADGNNWGMSNKTYSGNILNDFYGKIAGKRTGGKRARQYLNKKQGE